MRSTRTVWLLVLGAVCVSSCAVVQHTVWKKYNEAGMEAYEQGRYAEAKKQWMVALKKAEKFGPNDSRLATSLNNLAALYDVQGKYGAAKPLY